MNKSILVICLLLASAVYTYKSKAEMHRRRLSMEKHQGFHKRRAHTKQTRRTEGAWRPIKIFFDMSSINNDLNSVGGGDRIAFYKKVFDATGLWWENALKVNDDRSQITTTIDNNKWRYHRELGFNYGDADASAYDLHIRVFWCENNGNALAYAGPFLRHPDSKRPITGTTCVLPYGDENFKRASDSVNRAVGTMIHEFGHVISFISFQRYHSDLVKIDHTLNEYMWTGENVVAKAREYFNCPSITGVPLQNKGGRVGGHWSEDHLGDELMTPTTGADPEKVSLMTLALCEDTKWYKPDYSFAENYNFNKGRGCGVFRARCPSPAPCQLNSGSFTTSDYKGVGYCSQNGSGCATERKYSNMDCMKPSGWQQDATKFGASYGGNCVVADGVFKIFDAPYIRTKRQVSVQANCAARNTSYTLTFKNFQQTGRGKRTGDAVVRCTEEGTETFNNGSRWPSSVKCHDPLKFCTSRFGTDNQTCDDSCRKNGRCQHVKPQNRRLQGTSGCNKAGQPQSPAKFRGNVPATPTTNTNSGDQEWMCWCYRDGKRKLACGDLAEDLDGVGY